MNNNIPKIIWQTHNYKYEELPLHFKQIIKTWINLNPGWEYRYVDHEQRLNLIKKDLVLLKGYTKLPPVIQSDIWRYFVTYKNGGVYADMDSVCRQPLDYMLRNINKDVEMIVTEKNNETINCANFAIIKKSKIMKKILDSVKSDEFINEKWSNWRHPIHCFNDIVINSANVSYSFTAASHSKDYKKMFNSSYPIDYFGELTSYSDFIRKNNLFLE